MKIAGFKKTFPRTYRPTRLCERPARAKSPPICNFILHPTTLLRQIGIYGSTYATILRAEQYIHCFFAQLASKSIILNCFHISWAIKQAFLCSAPPILQGVDAPTEAVTTPRSRKRPYLETPPPRIDSEWRIFCSQMGKMWKFSSKMARLCENYLLK